MIAAIAQHLDEYGWTASLIPMGKPYQTEFAISYEWLGIASSKGEPGPLHLPKMTTKHNAGPPELRPTRPTGLTFVPALGRHEDVETVDFDVANCGDVTITY